MDEQLQHETEDSLDLAVLTEEKSTAYTKLSVKYEDVMSSATTMLFVGIAGLIFLVLVYLKVIPIPINESTGWLFDLVMGLIFVGFIIGGIISFLRAKQLKVDADAEDQLIEEILTWADANISKDALDEGLDCSQPEEILYFSRQGRIKDSLMHAFETADEPLLDDLSETVYQKLYESETNSEQ